jgi:hypothetical protein
MKTSALKRLEGYSKADSGIEFSSSNSVDLFVISNRALSPRSA